MTERFSNDFNLAHYGITHVSWHKVSCLKNALLQATKMSPVATILQKEVTRRQLLKNLSLEQ